MNRNSTKFAAVKDASYTRCATESDVKRLNVSDIDKSMSESFRSDPDL